MNLPNHIRTAIHTYVPTMDGGDWAELDRRCEVAELIYTTKPKVVVEIGTFGGAGALPMAFALRENNNGGKIYCIDPWRVEYATEGEWSANTDWYKNSIDIHDIHKKAMTAFWQHNLDPWLVVIRAASQYCAELFPAIDVLIIDGNHSEVASYRDAELYLPRVLAGGYILMDDLDWEVREGDTTIRSTQKALRLVETQCDLIKRIGNMGIYRKHHDS